MIHLQNYYSVSCDVKSSSDCHKIIEFGLVSSGHIFELYREAGWKIVEGGLFGPFARHACPACKEK